MEDLLSLSSLANLATFIAPGYFAIQVYSIRYNKREREFSRLLVESVVYSLPVVALGNWIWQGWFGQPTPDGLRAPYDLLLLILAVCMGIVFTFLRGYEPVVRRLARFGLGSPDEDFVKLQLLRIDTADPDRKTVTVKLRSGEIFSGTVDRFSRYTYDGPKYFYFADLAWYNERTRKWELRDGGVIVERSDIEYIETGKLKD